jgi:hypothetical protein
MTALPPADAGPQLDLALADLEHLFNAPLIDPLANNPPQQLGVSGVSHLADLLDMDKRLTGEDGG